MQSKNSVISLKLNRLNTPEFNHYNFILSIFLLMTCANLLLLHSKLKIKHGFTRKTGINKKKVRRD